MFIKNPIHISEGMAETIIAFVKNHEREEIPDDVWEVVQYLQEEVDAWRRMKEQEEKRLMSCCDRCVFWDYTKSRCSEWYELKIPNDSLHECNMLADMAGEE